MANDERTVYVYADWFGSSPLLIGRLYVSNNRGKELVSFEYSKEWIKSVDASFVFDPDLRLYDYGLSKNAVSRMEPAFE
jgi:serine/threonine-protein kinase HipA